MPRYFLHVCIEGGVERDAVGLEFASLSDAVADAKLVRAGIMNEDRLKQLRLEITDESGCVLANVGS